MDHCLTLLFTLNLRRYTKTCIALSANSAFARACPDHELLVDCAFYDESLVGVAGYRSPRQRVALNSWPRVCRTLLATSKGAI